MIVDRPADFLRALEAFGPPTPAPRPRGVLLVSPVRFRVSAETARDNFYMDTDAGVDARRAQRQFDGLRRAIEGAGIPVTVFEGRAETPDDVFPNNVFATVPGRLVVGAMCHPTRRLEAERADIRAHFTERLGYEVVDLSGRDCVAELTGSLVIDHGRRIGFCGLSHRADRAGAEAMHEAFGLALTYCFDLAPEEYHTNVVLSVLAGRACVLAPSGFADPAAAEAVAAAFPESALTLDDAEKAAFAANCIALGPGDLFLSATAARALAPEKRAVLERWGFRLHPVPVDEFEKAGGSLRCLVAEIF